MHTSASFSASGRVLSTSGVKSLSALRIEPSDMAARGLCGYGDGGLSDKLMIWYGVFGDFGDV